MANGEHESGIRNFMDQNGGEGWLLPSRLRLEDYGIGRDQRARESQIVAHRLGPRFYDWQVKQSGQQFWADAHLHARNILGRRGYARLVAEMSVEHWARGENPLDSLVSGHVPNLIGDREYLIVLLDICSRNLVDKPELAALASDLRIGGYLSIESYSEFSDKMKEHLLGDNSDSSRASKSQLDLFCQGKVDSSD